MQERQTTSKRELECLYWLSKGFTFKEIAEQMNISPRTVEHHIKNVKIKTDLYKRSQLVEYYFRTNNKRRDEDYRKQA